MINNMPISIQSASFYGFNCAHCNQRSVRTPVRYNDLGPFFCSFLCGFEYQGDQGNEEAKERAIKLREVLGMPPRN